MTWVFKKVTIWLEVHALVFREIRYLNSVLYFYIVLHYLYISLHYLYTDCLHRTRLWLEFVTAMQ